MERLTMRNVEYSGTSYIFQTGEAAYRLAIIEDILGDDYDLDRLRELVEADRDGRCVVLPCKIGENVWRIYDDCEFPGVCGTKRMCRGCEYRNLFVEKQAFCLSMLSQNGKLGHPYYTSIEAASGRWSWELFIFCWSPPSWRR